MNVMTEAHHRLAPARAFRWPDRHDRLRLDRQRDAATDRAAPRLRPVEIRRHRAGGRGSPPARRPAAAFHPCGDHQGELPRRARPAAHRRAGPRHDRQPLGRYLFGRSDGTRQGPRRLLHRHRGRAVARTLYRPQFVDLRALELRAARRRAGIAPPPARRRHRRELLRRQSRDGVVVRQAGAARRRRRDRPYGRRAKDPRRLGAADAARRHQGHPYRRARHPARARPKTPRHIRQHLVGRRFLRRGPAAVGARLGHAREKRCRRTGAVTSSAAMPPSI